MMREFGFVRELDLLYVYVQRRNIDQAFTYFKI